MFTENKWVVIYFNIINKAKLRGDNKRTISYYVERHHIIPRAMEGSNMHDNLVLLTPKEHFVCHHLLTKITTGLAKIKMGHAFAQMIFSTKYNPTARQYAFARQLYAESTRSVEWRQKISAGNKGKKRTDEYIKMMRERLTGRKLSDSHRENIRKASTLRGVPLQCRVARLKTLIKPFKVIFPSGEEIIIKNLKQYCLDNNLNHPTAANNSKTMKAISRGPLLGFNFIRL